MRIEDAFVDPDGTIVVTDRIQGGPVVRGSHLWLVDGSVRYPVVAARFLRTCARHDSETARAGENTAMILDGAPPHLQLRGLLLITAE
ncbi:hypothetical protein [Micromonospora sp. LOL_024]|uniref:hypothetical protein n=1 Tax=Micromonospora sp. LOL_024 TaxID=3345412 RepID=UPI003A893479